MKTFLAELYRSDEFSVPIPIQETLGQIDELVVFNREKFGVVEAKELRRRLHHTSVKKGNLVAVVGWKIITHEAEQSLLKILEEPPAGVRLILVSPHDTIFSPTIISRLKVNINDANLIDETTFLEWWKLPVRERLKKVEENLKRKDKDWLNNLKQSLSRYVKTGGERSKEFMVLAELVIRYLNKRGASNKMLLEALALVETN